MGSVPYFSLFSGISLSHLPWYFILLLNNLWNYIFKTSTPGGLIIAKLAICTLYTSICLTSPVTLHMNDFLRLFLCCCFLHFTGGSRDTGRKHWEKQGLWHGAKILNCIWTVDFWRYAVNSVTIGSRARSTTLVRIDLLLWHIPALMVGKYLRIPPSTNTKK